MIPQNFNGIGCASIADIELPSASSAYFKLDEGVHKIRVLQGPVLSFVSQEWDETEKKYIGDKKIYKFEDEAAKKDKNAKLQMSFLIYDYKEKAIVMWEIAQKSILEAIKNINGIQPDLSAFDLQVTRKKEGGKTTYGIAQGPNKPFDDQEVINEVIAKNILVRLEELKGVNSTLDEQEQAIEAEIAARKAAVQTPVATTNPTPEITPEEGVEVFK